MSGIWKAWCNLPDYLKKRGLYMYLPMNMKHPDDDSIKEILTREEDNKCHNDNPTANFHELQIEDHRCWACKGRKEVITWGSFVPCPFCKEKDNG